MISAQSHGKAYNKCKPEIEDSICKKKLECKIVTLSDLQHLTKHFK